MAVVVGGELAGVLVRRAGHHYLGDSLAGTGNRRSVDARFPNGTAMRNTVHLLRTSGERYQNFVEQSSEAVWRIELSVPMASGLSIGQQIVWLREHAYVAECNLTYLRLNRQLGLADAEARVWRADAPWSAILLDNIESAASRGYSMDGLQFTTAGDTRPITYITCFRGVFEQGKLARVWGVARDVTELVELNGRLRQKQERLQVYARQLVGAEERARPSRGSAAARRGNSRGA